jgi:hypothetical protein
MYFDKNGFPPSHVLDSNEVVSGPMTPDSTTTNNKFRQRKFLFLEIAAIEKNVCRTSCLATFGDQKT